MGGECHLIDREGGEGGGALKPQMKAVIGQGVLDPSCPSPPPSPHTPLDLLPLLDSYEAMCLEMTRSDGRCESERGGREGGGGVMSHALVFVLT